MAEQLHHYFDLMHDRLRTTGVDLPIYGSPVVEGQTWLTPETLDEADAILAAAKVAVETQPEYRARVNEARLSIAYARLGQARRLGTGEYGLFEVAPGGGHRAKETWPRLLDAFVAGGEVASFENVRERESPPAVDGEGMRRFFRDGMVAHLGVGRPVTLMVPQSPEYPADDTPTRVDGVKGTTDYRYSWLGREAVDSAIAVDLGEVREISRGAADFL